LSEIFRDDTLVITHERDGFYIRTFRKGRSPESFAELLKQIPFLEITSFQTVRKALFEAPYGPELFGVEKEKVSVKISGDRLEAYITLNMAQEKLEGESRYDLIPLVLDALIKAGVNYGVNLDSLKGDLKPNEPILIAQGLRPIHGRDSVIKMYEIQDPKPTVVEHGKVNYYDLNLINKVQAGDWLGERIDPIPGIPGKSVMGTDLLPDEGITFPLHYDHSSVELVREDGKDVLYSLKTGAVYYTGDTIAVYDVLEIKGNVDFNTGNIDFNGYVSIKGSVEENFSVRAGKDIEISGEYGIGGVNIIESLGGSIYIRGGITGKNRARILCKKNLYVKFLSDVEVICEGSVFVGFYIRNSTIRAKQVVVDSPRGQIVGGLIDTDIKVECADIGNWMETRTQINVRGFSRSGLQSRIDEIMILVRDKKEQMLKLKSILKTPDKKGMDSILQKTRHALHQIQDEIRNLEAERLSLTGFMKTPGEGAVIVKKRIFPKVRLVIQGQALEIGEETMASSFVVRDGMIQSI
jgi:uncharacterized protein (DUF342 family)